MGDVTDLLSAVERGEPGAADRLWAMVHDELRRLAAAKLAREQPGQTLDATALVHEAFLRLGGGPWANRRHFFAAAAEAMRRILIDNARHKQSERAGGGRLRADLVDAPAAEGHLDDLLALDEALAGLAGEDAEAAEVARLRLYAGLSVEEAADALVQSRSAAYRHWTYARAWLRCALA